MIARWKLRRELVRVKDRLAAWSGNLYEPMLQRRHDRWREAQPIPRDLGCSFSGKVAIFLIYQPNGIAASILCTLRWLVANGYSPLVIANTPIKDADRPDLEAVSWRLFERPNFGYDFGGYRDGILLLDEWGLKLDRLLIINDSVWMPPRSDSTLISRMESVDADLVGGTMHPAMVKRGGRAQPEYLESYLFLVNRKLLDDKRFAGHWRNFLTSSYKANAVRRGERRLTETIRSMGFAAKGLFSAQGLLDALSKTDTDTLRLTLVYGAYIHPAHTSENAHLLSTFRDSPEWKEQALDFMMRMVSKRRYNAVYPYPCDKLLGMDFIKKSDGSTGQDGRSLHVEMRNSFLKAVASGELPAILPEVQAEMQAANQRR